MVEQVQVDLGHRQIEAAERDDRPGHVVVRTRGRRLDASALLVRHPKIRVIAERKRQYRVPGVVHAMVDRQPRAAECKGQLGGELPGVLLTGKRVGRERQGDLGGVWVLR